MSGGYYGRFTVHGKQKWLRLDTDVFSVAKLRLADKAAEIETLRGSTAKVTAGKASVGELMTIYLARTKENPDLRPSSITSRVTALKKLKKTWPGIEVAEPRQITPAAIFSWVSRFKVDGTNYLPPQARTVIKGNSATSIDVSVQFPQGDERIGRSPRGDRAGRDELALADDSSWHPRLRVLRTPQRKRSANCG